MTCTGIVRGKSVELDGEETLPEGTRVLVIPAEQERAEKLLSLGEWLDKARELRGRMPMTSDSVEILREMREERSAR